MSRKSTEILATAADTFSTLQQLLDASKDSLTPAERRRLKALVHLAITVVITTIAQVERHAGVHLGVLVIAV